MSATSLIQAWKGQFSSRDGSAIAGGGAEIDPQDVDQVVRRVASYFKNAADAMAADATTAQDFFYLDTSTLDTLVIPFPSGIRVEAVSYTPQANVTANATNFATLIVEKATGAGAATTVASFATSVVTTNDLVALVPKSLVLVPAAVNLISGESLRFRVTKTAAGVVMAAGRIQVVFRVL